MTSLKKRRSLLADETKPKTQVDWLSKVSAVSCVVVTVREICYVSRFQTHYKIAWQITRGGPLFRRKIIAISRSDLIRNGSVSVRLKLSGHLLHWRDALKFRPCLHYGRLGGTLCEDYVCPRDGSSVTLLREKLEGNQWGVAEKNYFLSVSRFHHKATCLTFCDSFSLYTVPSWIW